MTKTIPIALELEGDARVQAMQRAEAFAPGLLISPEWNQRARGAVEKRLNEQYQARLAVYRKDKQGECPSPPTNADTMIALGIELSLDSFGLAQGYARGEGIIARMIDQAQESKP